MLYYSHMKKKVYLPLWQKKFVPVLLFVVWLFASYENFFGSSSNQMTTLEYIIFTIILLGVGVVVWMMASGKLPAYVIDDGNNSEEK